MTQEEELAHFAQKVFEIDDGWSMEKSLAEIRNTYLKEFLTQRPFSINILHWEYVDFVLETICESPIEQMMLIGLVQLLPIGTGSCTLCTDSSNYDGYRLVAIFQDLVILPQASISRYRVDFIVKYVQHINTSKHMKEVIVECDGHEFHETKEAATRDRQRDRDLKINGFEILRFTGSEIWKDPFGCADQVLTFLRN